jgi:hypothetical protein
MNLITRNQWFAIAILLFSVLMGGSAQLTDLLGPALTKGIISLATLINGFLAGVQIILGGQGQQVKDVLAMPGVDSVKVNAQANSALATIAVDPSQPKIAPTAADLQIVATTAEGAKA